MQRGTTQMDAELPVRLTAEEVNERAETMAGKLVHIGTLRKKRRDDLRSINATIESELDEVQRLARTIMDGVEARKQSDLRFGDEVVPSSDEATAALAKVAEIAEEEPAKRWHKDGALCRSDNCRKRIHVTNPEALRAHGIVVEGDPLVPEDEQPTQKCVGCDADITGLSAVERLKGMCEGCQTSKGGDPLGDGDANDFAVHEGDEPSVGIFEAEERGDL